LAKKSRTPAPPRKVQAPQRRTDPRRPRTGAGRSPLLFTAAFAGLGVLAAIVAAVFVFVLNDDGVSAPDVPDTTGLIGVQTGPAPWNPGVDSLPDRIEPLGLNALTDEGQVLHVHQHLDVFVNGKRQPVPANIGIYDGEFLTELHTHDDTGIMHVESPTKRRFDLGQFFGAWGVRLTNDCVGGYCRQVQPWTLYVNGQAYQGDPAALELKEHQEIAVVIGTPPKKIPRSYKFPAGL
jgi:hypothetical protein